MCLTRKGLYEIVEHVTAHEIYCFMGTPHRCSQYASWSEIASRMANLALIDTNRRILKDLKVDSEVFDRIQTDFVDKVYQTKTRVHTFYESSGYSSIKGLSNKVRHANSVYHSLSYG